MVKNDYIYLLLIHPPLSNLIIAIRVSSFKKQFNHWKEIIDYSKNGVPMFNGQNGFKYEMWSRRTKVFLQAQRHYIWLSVVTGYDSSKRAKTATKKELKKNNKIAMDFIGEGLPKPVREKVGKCSSSKELWISYMTYILHPSQIQKMPKKMQIKNKKKYAHHVREIQKSKSMKKKKLITEKN